MGRLQGFFDESKEYAHPGMIDWLTLRIDLAELPVSVIERLRSQTDKLCRISPDGEILWQAFCFESVRSDSHQVTVRIGSELSIQGSPARVGFPNNVFGSLDVRYCARKMVEFARVHLELESLPPVERWVCSRIDVTRNYVMQSGAEARQALAYLKQSPEGRQKHSFESHGFYIGKGSTMHHGKVYLKGQDARRNQKAGRAEYTAEQLVKADRLLRAELGLRRHRLFRISRDYGLAWYQLTPEHLMALHEQFFEPYFSEIEVADMGTILERLMTVAPTEGQARAAYDCYARIRMVGYEQARQSFTRPSWYRHLGHLKAIGMCRADLNSINIIPLRKRQIEVGVAARHWDDIGFAA